MVRGSKLETMSDALGRVSAGARLGIGGLWFHNTPSAAIHHLVRDRQADRLVLVTAPPSSYGTDLLVAAGLVATAYTPHVSFEHLGLAPSLRHAAETGAIDLVESDEATLLGGMMATVEGLAAHPVPSLRGTDHLQASPLMQDRDPRGVVHAPALRVDVAILHVQEADEYGNARHLGAPFVDPLLAKVADQVVVTADRIISNDTVREAPRLTTIPSYLVDAVVEAPFGALPCSSHGLYPHDQDWLQDYLEAATARARGRDAHAVDDYIKTRVPPHGAIDELRARAGTLQVSVP